MPSALIPKTGAPSVVWKYFGFRNNDMDQTTILCKTCKQVVSGKGGNTSNLFSHLKHKHPQLDEECMQMQETSELAGTTSQKHTTLVQHRILESFFSCTPYKKSSNW